MKTFLPGRRWFAVIVGCSLAGSLRADTLRLVVQPGYLPSIPVLVRVEALNADGDKNRDLWDAEAVLNADAPGVNLSTNRVLLKNGLGSALVTFTGGTNFNLTASLGVLQATRPMTDLSTAAVTTVSGTLPATAVSWSGVVRVTNDVTVPAAGTLTIQAGTLVLMNGVSSGTTAPDIFVNGAMQSLGTESQPVTITCASATQRWGQIRHSTAQPSLYRYTTITRAGRAAGEGHTGTAPVIRAGSSRITFEHCSITDHADASGVPGKVMYATGSELAFDDCLLARSRMGPEVATTAIVCSNTWLMEMRGPDDSDGIYIQTQNPGQIALLSGCVLAGGDDDGLDTLGSDVTVENCIIRDWVNPSEDAKGISGFHGEITVRRSIIVNCFVGVSAKSSGPLARVNLLNSTVTGLTRGIAAAYKDTAAAGNILFQVTNCIVRSVDAVYTDFGPTNFNIGYCNLAESWPGPGNFTADPLFVDAVTNYHLRLASPCLDAGDPATALDPDGTRADVGACAFPQDTVLPVGPVAIHEIMYHPVSGAGSVELAEEEFVELYNASGTDVALYDPDYTTNTWRVGGGIGFTFPVNATLPPYRTLLLVNFDPATNAAALSAFLGKYGVSNTVPIYGPFSGRLDNGAATVALYRPEAPVAGGSFVPYAPLDQVTYANAAPWPSAADGTGASLQRRTPPGYGNQPANWFAAAPAAGRANTGDSDGDGLPDDWELSHALDAFDPNGDQGAVGDPDQDGFNNAQEFIAGTHPNNGADYLRIESVAAGANGLAIRFLAAGGRTYSVLYSDPAPAGPWQKLADAPLSTNSALVEIVDPAFGSIGSRFYRLVAPSWPNP